MTQKQMVVAWTEESGHTVTRSAIAMKMGRYGVAAATPRPRYEVLLPWRVSEEHRMNIEARMLRLEGRRRGGGYLSPKEDEWLHGWLKDLGAADAVVMYDAETLEGFHWVFREPKDQDIIRRPE